jgi:hypothetical protein
MRRISALAINLPKINVSMLNEIVKWDDYSRKQVCSTRNKNDHLQHHRGYCISEKMAESLIIKG